MCTLPGLYAVVSAFDTAENPNPYEYIVADEAQDMSVPQLRLVASINSERPDALFFAGDLGQRIFQTPFSWKSLGVDVRGRSKTLRINYRTTHQIRLQADRLLPDEISDVDGNKESRSGTVSVFNGSPPVVHEAADLEDERRYIADWITQLIVAGVKPHEIGVVARSGDEIVRVTAAIELAGQTPFLLDGKADHEPGSVAASTMQLAKGLEFRAVAVIACDDEILPLQRRIESVADMADLEEVYDSERHLLYVACTRAREKLLVSGVRPVSEFLADMTH